jgi:hypothetical protein
MIYCLICFPLKTVHSWWSIAVWSTTAQYLSTLILAFIKNTNMNKTVKKKVNLINTSQNEGSSPSCLALSFDRFGSISWNSTFSALLQFSHFFFSDFHLFRPEYHWRELISRNAHLVHQNWHRISFTFITVTSRSPLQVKGCIIKACLCHIWCDMGPRFFRFHPQDLPIQSLFKTCKEMQRVCLKTASHLRELLEISLARASE